MIHKSAFHGPMANLFNVHSVTLAILAPLFHACLTQLTSYRSSDGPGDSVPDLPMHLENQGRVNEQQTRLKGDSAHRHNITVD